MVGLSESAVSHHLRGLRMMRLVRARKEGREVYYALDDFCPHMGASLGASDLHGEMVVCNRHMWAFRLADGTSPDVPTLRAGTLEVRLEGDAIQVRLPEKLMRDEG